jgi:flavodoxin/Pyruvate/2-oxoacid:ferredoxin oxidoreductase delta subunit
MKIGIYFHSGSGTTAKYAVEIAKGFKSRGHDTMLTRITHEFPETDTEFDIVGIGTPTMGFRCPRFVMKKIQNFKDKDQPYFLFNTCAGVPGNTFPQIYRKMKKKNWILIDSIISKGRGSSNIKAWRPSLEKPFPETDSLADEEFEKANNFADSVLDSYQKIIVDNTLQPQKLRLKYLMTPMIMLSDNVLAKGTVGKKKVLIEKCTKCGLCATKICPSGCITLNSENYPQFNEKLCISCNGCVNLCPELAIVGRGRNKHAYTANTDYILKIDTMI